MKKIPGGVKGQVLDQLKANLLAPFVVGVIGRGSLGGLEAPRDGRIVDFGLISPDEDLVLVDAVDVQDRGIDADLDDVVALGGGVAVGERREVDPPISLLLKARSRRMPSAPASVVRW